MINNNNMIIVISILFSILLCCNKAASNVYMSVAYHSNIFVCKNIDEFSLTEMKLTYSAGSACVLWHCALEL